MGHDERRSGDMGLALLLEARAKMALGDPASARRLLRQAVGPLEAGLGPEHEGTREAKQLLAGVGGP